ncbi:hypothetical protein FOA52_006332 [Chlamydomonas sp. UWO 241]|nr:hypothetical protein FOA52_006332 [Chlamydomonas sp. UWO 241]
MLPARTAVPPAGGPILDPDEPEAIQKLRREIHTVRVSLIRAAQRLGYDHENGLVKQVLYRLNLAEKLKAPWRKGKRPDPALAAAREAERLEVHHGPRAPLGFTVKMMLIGLTGSGKTQLIHSLLSAGGVGGPLSSGADGQEEPPCKLVDPFDGATKKVEVVSGTVHGIRVVCIDTPGLVASASATATNGRSLQQIRKAYNSHKPDLVVYVDRLDATARAGGELPALKVLSDNLGAGLWLNTIVALSHAGTPPPCGPKGQMSFDQYANQRSHVLQQVIRAASGDDRLMNPTAFVESHPGCALNGSGQAVIANGMPWKAHLYLMIVSAKLLADTENMLQMQDGSQKGSASAGAHAAAMMGGMGMAPPRTLPLPYLVSSLTQFSRPLKYPDHDLVLDVRMMESALKKTSEPRGARDLARAIKGRLLQLRQAHANKERMQRSFRNATLAGGKVTPEPPSLATRRPPSVHPPGSFRYRVPEPAGGWIVRPHIESHGMDNSDGIEGLYLEKSAVARRSTELEPPPKESKASASKQKDAGFAGGAAAGSSGSGGKSAAGKASGGGRRGGRQRSSADKLLGGVPFHHYVSAQVTKEAKTVQARTEASLYHDPLGNTTTTLSADVQTCGGGAGVPLDALVTARADLRRRGVLGSHGKATLGVVACRVAEAGRPHVGPAAAGVRLQQTCGLSVWRGAPGKLSMCAAVMGPLPGAGGQAPPGMAPGAVQMDGGAGGGPDRALCAGANAELMAELQGIFRTRESLPLTLGANAIRYRGEIMAGLACAMQYRTSKSEMVGGRLTLSSKSRAGLSVKIKSQDKWWAGLVAMALPLGTLLLQSLGLMR